MKLVRIYIKDFMCYQRAFIDFTAFKSAQILGKKENDRRSNGAGKTTIFKSIEYVLFNQSDFPLENLVRDDTTMCHVVLDFLADGQEYRLSRKRTKKGTSDLTLLRRTALTGLPHEVYHTDINEEPLFDEKFWKNLSGRRAQDTEKEVENLIKLNFKSFRSTVHFMQHDFASGLAATTPEKRKAILRDAFNLLVYTKLEKIAKEKFNALTKEIDRHKIIVENLGDPDKELKDLEVQFDQVCKSFEHQTQIFNLLTEEAAHYSNNLNLLNNELSTIESKFSSLISKEKSLLLDKSKIENSIKEYTIKKSNIAKSATELTEEIKSLNDIKNNLSVIDYSQIPFLEEENLAIKDKIAHHNVTIQNSLSKYEELKIPVPDDSVCKHCRQIMTEEHKILCKSQIRNEMEECQKNIQNAKKSINILNLEVSKNQTIIQKFKCSHQELDKTLATILDKNKEIKSKRDLYDEYNFLLKNFAQDLALKNNELEKVYEELNNSSLSEAERVKDIINVEKQKVSQVNTKILSLNKDLAHLNASKAVLEHKVTQRGADKLKKIDLNKLLQDLQDKFVVYPSVLQAFSSTGIPNLIIQNVLDDLQMEANNLLAQLKPELQLSFLVEKTKTDGTEADTLDIQYYVNGKERYYGQLSGAMQLSVMFSLKLGLSFLLQKMAGVDINFLLLDEIDQSLDEDSVDAFVDIVKFFQNDFTIMVITHNNRLKDKFSHTILVEQDVNMISNARVISS